MARLALALLILLVVGWLTGLVSPVPGDDLITEAIREWRSPISITAARAVTRLGDLWLVLLVTGLVWLGARRQTNGQLVRALMLSTVVGSQVLAGVLKLIVARPRPTGALETAISFAYPSGHALRAAAVYGLAAWAWHRSSPPRWRLIGVVLVALLATAIALSRLILGVHRPSEVVASVLLGLLWLGVVLHTFVSRQDQGW